MSLRIFAGYLGKLACFVRYIVVVVVMMMKKSKVLSGGVE